jgi:hypothetical protein
MYEENINTVIFICNVFQFRIICWKEIFLTV